MTEPTDSTEPTPAAAVEAGRFRPMVLMLVSTASFAAMHGAIRHVSQDLHMHPFEVAFFRNLVALLLLSSLVFRYGLRPFRTSRPGLQVVRGGLNAVAMLMFFYAVSITPLAEVAALSFTAPLFATLLAAVVLGEVVRLRRWTAVMVGFAGTLIVLQPGAGAFSPGALLIIGSSSIWAAALIVIKVLSRTESSVTITAYMAIVLTPLTFIPAYFVWQWPTTEQILWLVAIGSLGTVAQTTMAQAMKEADASALFPFDFTRLIWGALIGYIAFSEIPGLNTWIGGTVIFASTAYIAWRESKLESTKAR